ncbi:Prophenoloxidase, partial [Frankliniella occidentalis]
MPDARTLSAFTNVTPFVRWMADKIQDEEIRAAAAIRLLPLEIPKEYTASDLEEEQRVAYFREDVGLNLHHLHWHSYYTYLGPRDQVEKDRRGELLYYMHAQLLARYNGERLSNSLPKVKHLNLREPIKEAYYPKLDNLVSSRVWPSRPPNVRLQRIIVCPQDINRDGFKIDVEDLERWTARIYDAIAVGYVVNTTGGRLPLTEEGGANLLGNIIESSAVTPNRQLYGELMNQGHILISLAHDPENRFLESYGVMGDGAVALRDPVFYRWHAHVWDVMRAYKDTLPGYTAAQLSFPGVRVLGAEVRSEDHAKPNELLTHWQASDLELSRGLDFSPRRPIFARLTHLQHRPFAYHIRVESAADVPRDAYVRIFMAPKLDERGRAMHFRDQRHLMIEMDKFHTILKPGLNTLKRLSSESSVTIPFERTFRNLDANRPGGGRALTEFTFCGCGLPQHMLVPRGTEDGLPHQLFVMVTDFARDRVDQVLEGSCLDAPSLCGVFAGRYPDRRPMGFPFDRRPAGDRVDTLRSFLTPNMFVQRVMVRFRDAVEATVRNTTRFGTTKGTVKVTHGDPVPAFGTVHRDHLGVPTPGLNTLKRLSSESSVTIPFERTFRNLDANRPGGGRALTEFTFCGCGLPQHML